MLTVACVKAKPAYDHHYVNRLYRAVQRNLTIPHKFVCFTDDTRGVQCPTKQLPKGLTGWWSKLAMFKAMDESTFYLDLDTLIVGNLDFIGEYKGDFAILRDFYRPDGYGSGVMMWNQPRHDIWFDWLKAGTPNHPLGDQGWMEQKVKNADRFQDLFPDKFISYKVHCANDVLPKKAAVLSFHGVPKPEDFPDEHWVSKRWKN